MQDGEYQNPSFIYIEYENMPLNTPALPRRNQVFSGGEVINLIRQYQDEFVKNNHIYYGFLTIILLISATHLSIGCYWLINFNDPAERTDDGGSSGNRDLPIRSQDEFNLMSQKVEYILRTVSHTLPKGIISVIKKETNRLNKGIGRLEVSLSGSMLDLNLIMGNNHTFKLSTGNKENLCRNFLRWTTEGDKPNLRRKTNRGNWDKGDKGLSDDHYKHGGRGSGPGNTDNHQYTGDFDQSPPIRRHNNKGYGLDIGRDFSKTIRPYADLSWREEEFGEGSLYPIDTGGLLFED